MTDHAALVWRKAARSGGEGGDCVEVADLPDSRLVRDSKDPAGPMLTVSPRQWAAFTTGIRSGDFS